MQTIEQSREMAKLACEALADKKGEDIRVIDIAGISVLADYFIIANGTNESQVRALVDNVEETLGKAGYEVKQREGYGLGSWVLLDLAILSFMYLTEKTVFSMIWKESGKTENRLIRKNYKKIQNENVLRHILFLNVKSRACALLF